MPINRKDYDKIGRNEPCGCGSGRKHKHCHLRILQEMEQFVCMEKHAIERKKKGNKNDRSNLPTTNISDTNSILHTDSTSVGKSNNLILPPRRILLP